MHPDKAPAHRIFIILDDSTANKISTFIVGGGEKHGTLLTIQKKHARNLRDDLMGVILADTTRQNHLAMYKRRIIPL